MRENTRAVTGAEMTLLIIIFFITGESLLLKSLQVYRLEVDALWPILSDLMFQRSPLEAPVRCID